MQTHQKISTNILAFGFTSVLLLMLIITVIGLSRITIINKNLEGYVHQHHLKSDLVTQMLGAASDIAINLNLLSIVQTPAEREESYTRFVRMGTKLNDIRSQIKTTDLSSREIELLYEQEEFYTQLVPVQEKIVELVFMDHFAQAQYILAQNAQPLQNKILEKCFFLVFLGTFEKYLN